MYWFRIRNRRARREDGVAEAAPGWAVGQQGGERRAPRAARLPRFRDHARDQLREQGQGKFDRMRIKFSAVFTPAQPVIRRERFAGRTDALARLIGGIEDQRLHAILYGDRGIGKTSLLHILADTAREAGYVVLYESCDAGTGFDEMFRSVLAQIPQLYHGGTAPVDEAVAAGGSLLELAPAGELSPRLVTDLLAAVAGARVILMLDEFDRVTSADFRRGIAELIKNLSDRCARVQLVVAGVAANFTELVAHIPSIRRNVLNLELPRMTDAEIEEIIAIGAEESGLGFSASARLQIRAIAHGYPYIATLLAHHAGLQAIDARADEVSLAHVAAAVDALEAYICPPPPGEERPMPAPVRLSAASL